MASAEAAADSSGPRFAPDDPTLPAPWKALIDGATLYYWNPETNVTQYDKPAAAAAAAAPPLPAAAPAPVPGAFAQPGMQLGGQAGQQQQPQQTAQQPPFQYQAQQQQPQQTAQQPPFQYQAPQAQQVPYHHQQQQEHMGNQQQMSQQPPAPQYPNAHPHQMLYQHGPYMQPQQQGQQYSYQAGQHPQMPQTPYNQGQQPPIPQAANQGQQPTMPPGAYTQGQRPPMPQSAYSHGPRPPMPQAAYNQGQQPQMPQAAYNQGQQPQMPQAAYDQGQQLQGARIPQSQVQHTKQSPGFHQPAQASQVLPTSQPQGLQMSPRQGQPQHGFQFTHQQGKQPHQGHIGAHVSQLSHGQQSSAVKLDAGGHEGMQSGFALPISLQRGQAPPLSNQQLPSNHQRPEAHNQLSIHGVHGVGGPAYPAKHHLGGSSPGETNKMSFMSLPAQAHQGGVETNYRQQLPSSHAVPNHITPSPGQPPIGFNRSSSEDQFEKNEPHSSGRFDGINALQQQPKLAALPPSQIRLQDMRNGAPYPQPDNFGGYNMAPPNPVQNPHNHVPFPIGALTRPPPGTFSPPDFPSVASVDAYREHHEVTAVVMS